MTTQSPSPDALLPSMSELVKRLTDSEDATFTAWRNAQQDHFWARFDLSALRIGYELGRATPAPSADRAKPVEQPTTAREGCELIAQERRRQIEQEDWTPKHDDTHDEAELAKAAAHYVLFASKQKSQRERERGILGSGALGWPWDREWWKPSLGNSDADRIRELVKAGALIAAEIDRLNRKTPT